MDGFLITTVEDAHGAWDTRIFIFKRVKQELLKVKLAPVNTIGIKSDSTINFAPLFL